MSDEQDAREVSQCARCHCSVPIKEWVYIPPDADGNGAFRHIGPLRDRHPDKYVEPDENGDVWCNWIKRVPVKI